MDGMPEDWPAKDGQNNGLFWKPMRNMAASHLFASSHLILRVPWTSLHGKVDLVTPFVWAFWRFVSDIGNAFSIDRKVVSGPLSAFKGDGKPKLCR